MAPSATSGPRQQQAFATIQRLCRLLAGGTDTLSLLRAILQAALSLTESRGGVVLRLLRGERLLRSVAQIGAGWHDGQEIAADRAPWGSVVGKGKSVYTRAAISSAAALSETAGTSLILPLLAYGDVLGVLAMHGGKRPLKAEKMVLETLAHLAAHVVHQADRARDLEQHRAELTTLIEVGQDVSASLEPDEVLKRVVRQATRLMRAKVGSLMLVDTVSDTLHLRATYGASQTYTARPPLALGESLVGEVVRTGLPLAVLDVREHARYQFMEMARQEGLCSLLSVPLRTNTRVIGVLNVYTVERRRFRPEEAEFLAAAAALSATAIENARLYQAMIASQEQLRQSERLAALGSMLAGLAHEIRNPLHTMQLLVYAIQQDCAPQSPLRADVEVLQSEIARLALLVDQCLDVARPRAPEQKRQKLHEVMEETLLVVSTEAKRRHIQLRKHWGRELPAVLVDGAQMKQVFLNVLLNAMQAMESGGAIDVSLLADEHRLTALIQDQGQGIPEAVQAQLFTPFFTTKPQGTGLGLSISQRIVEGHGGCMRIASRPGEGTTVAISVPRTSEP
ncbi:MAG: GAF domain-containing protein [Candidatus Tectimicrobiota bacterium]